MPRAKKRVQAKRPGRYHHGDLRRELLNAALVLIEREGTGRHLSLRATARLAGVSEAAPYRHFADRSALLAAVAEEGFRAMAEAMAPVALLPADSPLERMQALGVAYVQFASTHSAHYRVMFSAEMTDKSGDVALETSAEAAFVFLRDAVAECQQAGLLRPGEPRELALAAWSVVHGLSSLIVDGQVRVIGLSPEDSERMAESVTRDLLAGLIRRTDSDEA